MRFFKIKRNKCCFADYLTGKTFTFSMHLGVNESICFKLGVMTDNTKPYILVTVKVYLTCVKSRRGERKQNLSTHYLTKFSVGLDGIWSAVET